MQRVSEEPPSTRKVALGLLPIEFSPVLPSTLIDLDIGHLAQSPAMLRVFLVESKLSGTIMNTAEELIPTVGPRVPSWCLLMVLRPRWTPLTEHCRAPQGRVCSGKSALPVWLALCPSILVLL